MIDALLTIGTELTVKGAGSSSPITSPG
jgi:hypothetical protein